MKTKKKILLTSLIFPFTISTPSEIEVFNYCYFKIIPPFQKEPCPKFLETEVPCPDPLKQAGMPCPYEECISIETIPAPGYEDTGEYYSVNCTATRTVAAICSPCYVFEFPVPVNKLPPGCPKELIIKVPCGVGLDTHQGVK